ncbi:hypothetical protein P692DRAFT_20879330 [Suillus brevipes Sb2]|nr:hypothetical protein P692DRAFT_20879330 [Suillus brevipes Sb2]
MDSKVPDPLNASTKLRVSLTTVVAYPNGRATTDHEQSPSSSLDVAVRLHQGIFPFNIFHELLSQVCLHDFSDGGVCTAAVSTSVLEHSTELIGICVYDDKNIKWEASTKIVPEELYSWPPSAEHKIPLKMPLALAFFVEALLVAFEVYLGVIYNVGE